MIEDEQQQYRTTKQWAERFEQELWALRALPLTLRHPHPKIRRAQEDSLQSTIDDLEHQARTHEAEQAAKRPRVAANRAEAVAEAT